MRESERQRERERELVTEMERERERERERDVDREGKTERGRQRGGDGNLLPWPDSIFLLDTRTSYFRGQCFLFLALCYSILSIVLQ